MIWEKGNPIGGVEKDTGGWMGGLCSLTLLVSHGKVIFGTLIC